MPEETTPFDQMGGAPFFATLVHRFYEGVAEDPVLRPMYPPGDLAPAERRMRLFLTQYWGGPGTYSEERGHPRLRMRHSPYAVDDTARDRWVGHMRSALDDAKAEHGLDPALERELWAYLTGAAIAMVNTAPSDITTRDIAPPDIAPLEGATTTAATPPRADGSTINPETR